MRRYDDLAVIILAAGKGTRMKSDLAKVLHKVAGKSMIVHVIECAQSIGCAQIHVVVGHQAEDVKKEVNSHFKVHFSLQKQLLGTGDAVKAAVPNLDDSIHHILVLCGDVPLIRSETMIGLVEQHLKRQSDISVLAVDLENPYGYGRMVLDDQGHLLCIREEADANEQEKKINKINTGIFCFKKEFLVRALGQLKPENNQSEYYLTDTIGIAKQEDRSILTVTMDDPDQVIGVNTLDELARAEGLLLKNVR